MAKENKEQIRRELEALGSKLRAHSGQEAFRVPPGYFEGLPSAIRDRIHSREESTQASPAWLLGRPRRLALAVVSMVVLLAFSVGFFLMRTGPDTMFLADEAQIESYFQLLAATDPVLANDLLLDSDIFAESWQADPEAFRQVEEEAILDYLFEQSMHYGLDPAAFGDFR